MKYWEPFLREKLTKIFTEKNLIIDIGGGLRIDPKKNNRDVESQLQWLSEYLPKVDYKVLDKVGDYNPDIVGDIHQLPLKDNSVDAIICKAVLEHVEEPHKAMAEMYRVLKPGGYIFIYTPFLYYYHPMKGYYGDFYRYTIDGLKYLTRNFKNVETQSVRGPFATSIRLIPPLRFFEGAFALLDKVFGKEKSNQTSGYYIFGEK